MGNCRAGSSAATGQGAACPLAEKWQRNEIDPLMGNDWLSLFAMAVNEENAAADAS